MHEKLICLLRQPTGLAMLVSRARREFVRPKLGRPDEAEPLSELDPYLEEVRSVREGHVPAGLLASVRESWDALSRISVFDAQTLFHVLHVLVYTVPDGEIPDIPPLKIELPPPPIRPTAAHPRAYRGTKARPPKAPRVAPVDLRPHLCVPGDVNLLLAHLAPHLPKASPMLERADLSPDRFARLLEDGKTADPYLLYCHSAPDRSVYELPAKFRTRLLFWLRGHPWGAVADALSLYWGLGLATDDPLLGCFSRLLADLPLLSALEWGRILLQQPVSRRVAFAELLIAGCVQDRSPSGPIAEAIAEVDRLSPDHVYRHRMHALVVAIRRNEDLGYLLDGFWLAHRYKVEHEFDDVGTCEDFSRVAVEEFIEHVTRSESEMVRWRPPYALSLWEACAELEGFGAFLEGRPWTGLEPDLAYEAINLFREVGYGDLSAEGKQAKWQVLREFAPRLFALLDALETGYREKAIRCFRDLVWFWDEPEPLRQNLERYRLLLPRLCREPFDPEMTPDVLTSLTLLSPAEWAELTACDEDSFLKMEKESRRENDARLVARGVEAMTATAGEWLVRGFRECPAHLFRAVHILGCMRAASRQEVLRSWLSHPLLTLDAERLTVEELVMEFDSHAPAGVYNPIPRKLREAVRGKCELRPGQVERGRRAVLADLTITRIDLLRRLALDRLSLPVGSPPDTAEARHAVCLQGYIRDNRRALRRFLRAHFAGQKSYLTDHPSNRDWLARHPRVANSWMRGLDRQATLPDSSKLHLAVEQNPLEVLRLGTHVGTCLGLGGMMAHSAAAVVLDVNKHVVYARDSSGAVVGRQLIALSEDEQLVCFEVYPAEVDRHIKQAFRDYDLALAEVLGVEVHDPTHGGGYEIATPVSSDWWDDNAWDGETG